METKTELPINKYRIKDTGAGSAKFGVCEVCGKHANTIYHQITERLYIRPDHTMGFFVYGDVFGHKSCLIKKRVNEIPRSAIEYDKECNVLHTGE